MAAARVGDDAAPGGAAEDLSIGGLAAATGVAQGTIRSWENRYDFPRPQRRPSGHRRYSAHDVDMVRRVLHAQANGVSLPKAISEVTAVGRPVSIFAALRHGHPDLPVMRVRKRTLLALTWALEDECCARAQRPLLVGTFQHERFLRQAQPRWAELARTARRTIVFAETVGDLRPDPGFELVSLASDAVLRREWNLVCASDDITAVLSAWELPGQDPRQDSERMFEAVWSLQRPVVQDAARVALTLAGLDLDDDGAADLTADGWSEALGRASGTLARAMSYLDERR